MDIIDLPCLPEGEDSTEEEILSYEKDIISIGATTTQNIPSDRVVSRAFGKLKDVVIIGYDYDGAEYFASSIADGPEVNWLLDRAKFKLVKMVDN